MSSKPLQLILVVLCLVSVPAFSQAPQPDTPQLEKNVDELLSKLSLEQKIGLLTGTDDMFIHNIPEIGMPAIKMSDGPVGVRRWGPSTAYPSGIAMAASWDRALANTPAQ